MHDDDITLSDVIMSIEGNTPPGLISDMEVMFADAVAFITVEVVVDPISVYFISGDGFLSIMYGMSSGVVSRLVEVIQVLVDDIIPLVDDH